MLLDFQNCEVKIMEIIYTIVNYLYQFMDSFSFLVLAALGLAIIFGMMGIINQAHGEFIMLGAYVFTIARTAGIPYILCILLATIFVAVFGLIIDRLIVCRLYNRPLDSIVATWGVSMVMTQGMRLIFGSTMASVATPFGSISFGSHSYSVYRIVLFVIAIILLIAFYVYFMKTKSGLHSRATIQNAEIAKSLGVNTNKAYAMTFMLGSGLAGLAGALYAPLQSVSPEMGQGFVIQSYATVIVGGANPLIGTELSGAFLGVINGFLSLFGGQFVGRIGLLIAAIICIRVLPKGFSGLVEKRSK